MDFYQLISNENQKKLKMLVEALHKKPEGQQKLWIPVGLIVEPPDRDPFPAEATLSRFEMHGETYYTIILRNINDRVEAESKIHSLTEEAEYLREEIRSLKKYHKIIGQSPALLKVLRKIQQVADTDSTVLIEGETGTGKELLAREIHRASNPSHKSLIKVNCAAIPSGLIESEFFGHAKGAFTGATEKREGRFSLADGGTIFLDEISELPLDLQPKLLRVLQEGEFEPVGSSKSIRVNVRVIAATNRDLYNEVREGNFRQDLYYRLNVFPVTVPPLRERTEDIPLLAKTFAQKFARQMRRPVMPLSSANIEMLKSYHWPGNVRELQNVLERAVITSQDGKINFRGLLRESEKPYSIHSRETPPTGNQTGSHYAGTGGTGERKYHQRTRTDRLARFRCRGCGRVAGCPSVYIKFAHQTTWHYTSLIVLHTQEGMIPALITWRRYVVLLPTQHPQYHPYAYG